VGKGIGVDIVEQTLYVPYSMTPPGDCWSIDAGLQLIMSCPEELAAANAVEFKDSHIYFFAELFEPDESVDDDQPALLHRDAVTGQFVTDDYADENPDTTVTENEG